MGLYQRLKGKIHKRRGEKAAEPGHAEEGTIFSASSASTSDPDRVPQPLAKIISPVNPLPLPKAALSPLGPPSETEIPPPPPPPVPPKEPAADREEQINLATNDVLEKGRELLHQIEARLPPAVVQSLHSAGEMTMRLGDRVLEGYRKLWVATGGGAGGDLEGPGIDLGQQAPESPGSPYGKGSGRGLFQPSPAVLLVRETLTPAVPLGPSRESSEAGGVAGPSASANASSWKDRLGAAVERARVAVTPLVERALQLYDTVGEAIERSTLEPGVRFLNRYVYEPYLQPLPHLESETPSHRRRRDRGKGESRPASDDSSHVVVKQTIIPASIVTVLPPDPAHGYPFESPLMDRVKATLVANGGAVELAVRARSLYSPVSLLGWLPLALLHAVTSGFKTIQGRVMEQATTTSSRLRGAIPSLPHPTLSLSQLSWRAFEWPRRWFKVTAILRGRGGGVKTTEAQGQGPQGSEVETAVPVPATMCAD